MHRLMSSVLVVAAAVAAFLFASASPAGAITFAQPDGNRHPKTGDGGTCFGDSGGPHFLGGATSNLLVATTVTGDSQCRAFDKSYRVDTASARAFLGEFVDLP